MTIVIVCLLAVSAILYVINHNRAVLARRTEELQRITDSLAEGLFVVNEYRMISFANPAAERLLKYAPGEFTGKTVHTVFARHAEPCPVCQAIDRGLKYHSDEQALLTKERALLPVEFTISPLFEKGQKVIGAVVAFRDVSERQEAQKALAQERSLLRTMIDTIPDPVYMKNADGRYIMINTAFAAMMGKPEVDILGKTIFDFFPEAESRLIADTDQQVVQSGAPVLGQEILFSRLGEADMWASRSTAPMRHASGAIFGLLGINRDITPLKRIEAQLLEANQELQEKNAQLAELNANKDKFFSIISHDLRSPFNTLLGFIELLAANLDQYSAAEIRSKVLKVKTSAETLYALLENLLTWSRLQRGLMACQPETLELEDLVEDNLLIFLPKAEEKGIALTSTIPAGMQVCADYSMVNTILRNLTSNALKFTAAGGTVTLSAAQRAGMLEIAVCDTGQGIDPEGLTRLFRLGAQYTNVGTSGEPGTGLGLNLCKEMIARLGGAIAVESMIGHGTTFRFTLPIAPQES